MKRSPAKQLLIVANLKAEGVQDTAYIKLWLREGIQRKKDPKSLVSDPNKAVVFAPSFLFLLLAKQILEEQNASDLIQLCAQDVSTVDPGRWTGETTVEMLANEGIQYVIVGHSERHRLGETNAVASDKARRVLRHAGKSKMTPILCVTSEFDPIPDGVKIVAYEPPSSIGNGHAVSGEHADAVAKIIKERNNDITAVLYGGSVNPSNVRSFTDQPFINGVLVGTASLDPKEFFEVVENA